MAKNKGVMGFLYCAFFMGITAWCLFTNQELLLVALFFLSAQIGYVTYIIEIKEINILKEEV